jgi:chaperonin GroES
VRSVSRFQPGEWKPVDFTGDDIKKHIFPLPTKEPLKFSSSYWKPCHFSGKELASVAEIFVGKMPGQNTPATTTMATIEQGLKVFTAIYKRIFRALGEEYAKLFALNSKHMDDKVYFTINAFKVHKLKKPTSRLRSRSHCRSSPTLTRTSSARHRS